MVELEIIEEHAAAHFKGSGIHFQTEASVGRDGDFASGGFPGGGFLGFVAREGQGEFTIEVDLSGQGILLVPISVAGSRPVMI